ncbi:MAG: 3-methyl-2-oxobutanoate hydroxymethyltransferase [Candidatus Aureabacteria bacterium]|nr:3-methyl-2-oxobutanoate hydroxymethyltransferase [Candidatus Auribacterota bacterium]
MKDKLTPENIKKLKHGKRKIVAITAYDWATAALSEEASPEIVLVGDSLSMVALGYENTLPVTMDEMIHHTKAVVRAGLKSLIVADMPFMSCGVSVEDTVFNAGRFIKKAGAGAVKIEWRKNIVSTVRELVGHGIPVMGHIGLTPQDVLVMGGYKVQGKTPEKVEKLLDNAKELEDAGVFSIVVECVPTSAGKKITESVNVPTIGIGAGPCCDGQIMVFSDIAGLYDKKKPKFVKVYAEAGKLIRNALASYAREVREGKFPDEEHSY